jgi:hypothetical protein
MKKLIAILLLFGATTACTVLQTAYQTDNYNLLRIGMTKWEVENYIGPPTDYLAAHRSPYGYEEILLFHNRYNEPFALEFRNDYLVSANYVHNGEWYPMYPVPNRPAYGNPAFPPSYRPSRPYYPPSNNRPPSTSRPGNNAPAQNYDRPSSSATRPPAAERPATERPATNNNRPSTPSSGQTPPTTSRPSSRPDNNTETTRPSSTERPASTTRSSGQSNENNSRGNTSRNR